MRKAAAVLLLALALSVSGCTSGPLHVTTAASGGVQSAFLLAKSAEQQAFEAGLLAQDQHLALLIKLKQAAKTHEDAAKLMRRAAAEGASTPPEYAALAAQALALLEDVLEFLPESKPKTEAAAAVAKGVF